MGDKYSKVIRSKIMRSVKSNQNRSTELLLLRIFKEHHITGWRRKYQLPGKPDFVFHKLKIVVFTDGCFWHGHSCRTFAIETNVDYWSKKIENNRQRDLKINKLLSDKGWKVIRLWECKLKEMNETTLKSLGLLN